VPNLPVKFTTFVHGDSRIMQKPGEVSPPQANGVSGEVCL